MKPSCSTAKVVKAIPLGLCLEIDLSRHVREVKKPFDIKMATILLHTLQKWKKNITRGGKIVKNQFSNPQFTHKSDLIKVSAINSKQGVCGFQSLSV